MKGVMNSLEQESLDESTEGSTTDGGPKKFCSLAEIYADTLEEEFNPDKLVLLAAEEPTICCEAVTEMMWQEAMRKKLEAIEKNKTWTMTNLPPRHKPIDLKWVFKFKKNSETNVINHKARLVAKGYVQRYVSILRRLSRVWLDCAMTRSLFLGIGG